MATIRVVAVLERVVEVDLHYSIGKAQADTHDERQRVVDVNGAMVLDGTRGELKASGRLLDGDTVRIIRAEVVEDGPSRCSTCGQPSPCAHVRAVAAASAPAEIGGGA